MANNIHDIEIQLINYFAGILTDDERLKIDQWRQESPENEDMFQELMNGWMAIPLLNEMEKFNSFEALKKVSTKLESYNQMNWINFIKRIAAVLIVPLLTYAIYISLQNFSLKQLSEVKPIIQTVTAQEATVSHLTLNDGTQVWLHSGSTLQFPTRFTGEKREVKLTGEAYFEVVKNENQAFSLNVQDLNIEVLGTSFNVVSYDDEAISEVVLVSGKVKLFSTTENHIKDFGYMHPGQKAVYARKSQKVYSEDVNVDKYVAWREGKLIFRDDSMSEVVKRLSRWFNVDISIADPEINDYIYTATFSDENLLQVLYLLKISAPINYTVVDRKTLPNGEFTKQKIILMKK